MTGVGLQPRRDLASRRGNGEGAGIPISELNAMALTLWHLGCARPLCRRRRALRRVRLLLQGLLVVPMLASCTLGPDFMPPEAPPVAGYLPAHDRPPGKIYIPGGDIPARWWEVFRSRHLNDLVELGI